MAIKVKAIQYGSGFDPCCCDNLPVSWICQSKSGFAPFCGFTEWINPSNPWKHYRRSAKIGKMVVNFAAAADCSDIICTAATLTCRTRGGTASLVGIAEYTTPSTPPKKYRMQTLTGQQRTCSTNNPYLDCNPSVHGGDAGNERIYGTVVYDALTGVPTNTQYTQSRTITAGSPCGDGVDQYPPGLVDPPAPYNLPAASADRSLTTTPTQSQSVGFAVCRDTGGGSTIAIGTKSKTLSDEDMDSDALARLLAGAGGTWSSYQLTGDGTGGTCLPSSCCRAARQTRTTGFTFEYKEAQFKIIKTGLTPSKTYQAQVDVMRRPYGVGSYAKIQTLIVSGTTDGAGNLEIADQAVPNIAGFETYVANACVQLNTNIADSWHLINQYNKDTCALTQTDTSERLRDGVHDPAGVSEADYAGLIIEDLLPTVRELVGNNTCGPTAPGAEAPYGKATGDVTDELNDEDLPADAIARATAGQDWSSMCDSTNNTTFEICDDTQVAYRVVQFKATVTGCALHTGYTITFHWGTRIAGSAGPYIPSSITQVGFDSGESSTYVMPDWIPEPLNGCEENDSAGFETALMSIDCKLG